MDAIRKSIQRQDKKQAKNRAYQNRQIASRFASSPAASSQRPS